MPLTISNNSSPLLSFDRGAVARSLGTDPDSSALSNSGERVAVAEADLERPRPVSAATAEDAVYLQLSSSFEEFSNSQRQALQLYTSNQRAALLSDSAQLVVGVDTFV